MLAGRTRGRSRGKVTTTTSTTTSTTTTTVPPAAATTVDGLDYTAWGTSWPADATGDVGPNDYVQAVNSSFAVFDKATRVARSRTTFNAFFAAAGQTGPCATANRGDPSVLYDSVSGRWVVADFAYASTAGPFYECIAVSKAGDPVTGGWWTYAFTTSATALHDYPRLSAWADGIYMTANMYTGGTTFTGAKVWALNRADLTSGAPLRTVSFQLSSSYANLLAANAKRNDPPAGTAEYLVSLGTSTSLRVWRMAVNWSTPANSTLTGPTSVTVPTYTKASSVPQPTGDTLGAVSDRLMPRLQYSAAAPASLWVNHSVALNSVAAPRWYRIDVSTSTPTLAQSGTFQPTTGLHRWMGSIAVDKLGDAAIAYSVSSASVFPGLRWAGRTAAATPGTFNVGEQVFLNGIGAQSGGANRWGDFSDLSVDPTDGCTFWYTGSYYGATGSAWSTRLGSFRFPTCA